MRGKSTKREKNSTLEAQISLLPSALMEFFYNKDAKVARNLFEFGLKAHSTDTAYILKCIERTDRET